MARQQAADYDQKRELITKEAAKLFAREGFDGASILDLATACNTSKSLIYHYYSSKEEILFDVMNAHMKLLLEIIDDLEAMDAPAADLFRQLSRGLMRRYTGAANSQKVLLYELNNLPKPQQKEIIAMQRQIIDFAEELLKRATPDVQLDHGRLRAHVMLFFGMLNWTHNWFKQSGAISRDDIADMAANTTLSALE
ncbi:MAG: TetR family transcriptional regulator [Marinicaulis sp.]|nr:TetR family transcriptional regulator [Marinicaulis sp.]